MYLRSVFGVCRSFFCTLVPVLGVQGTSAKTTLLETILLRRKGPKGFPQMGYP